MDKGFLSLLAVGVMTLTPSCQTPNEPSENTMIPAVIISPDEATMAKISDALGSALGLANVSLGAMEDGDLTSISVLPPALGPLESRSTVTPIIFDAMIAGSRCVLVRRDTGDVVELDDVPCQETTAY